MSSLKPAPGFDAQSFLLDYWQKKPLLIKSFFDDFSDLISAEEVAGLACEEAVESRLVWFDQDAGDAPPLTALRLQHGPLAEARFDELGQRDWTLLVQSVDLFSDEVAALKQAFAFLPSWRLEDVMVSFAAPGGGVGPHFDYYDVFLVQGSGQRRWRVGPRCDAEALCRNQDGLLLLDEFQAEAEYLLQPGDALYLPPRYAHWGVAEAAGLCYSVGLRSPSLAESLEGVSDRLMVTASPAQRFEDANPVIPVHGAEISPDSLDGAYRDLLATISVRSEFNRWFGCHVSQPRYPELLTPPMQPFSLTALSVTLRASDLICWHPVSRQAFMQEPESSQALLFVDGECYPLPLQFLQIFYELCDLNIENKRNSCIRMLESEGAAEVLLTLLNQGSLQLLGADEGSAADAARAVGANAD